VPQQFDDAGVGQEVALPQGVGVVLPPGVLGVDATEGGVDPASRQHRVGVVAATLANHHDLAASLVGGDAARSPAAPVPITKTLATLLRSDKVGMVWAASEHSATADPPNIQPSQDAALSCVGFGWYEGRAMRRRKGERLRVGLVREC
jgi:hypothetical protein